MVEVKALVCGDANEGRGAGRRQLRWEEKCWACSGAAGGVRAFAGCGVIEGGKLCWT